LEQAAAQTAPTLGTAQSFAVLGASTVTNTGASLITGNLGVNPGTAVTGFPPGVVAGGSTHAADAAAVQAQTDATTAYGQLAGQACNTTYSVPTDLGGQTLVPGVYCFSSSAAITGALTLDAGGNSDAVFIFEVGSTLITASNASVVLINGAQPCDVFWQVGSSATLGTGTSFVGTVLALASITLDTDATMSGQALAQTGAVTLDTNTVSVTSCSVTANSPPVLSESFSDPTIVAGGNSTLTIAISNPNDTAASVTSSFTDSLPSGLVVSGSSSSNSGGTVSAPIGGSTLTWTGGSIAANGTTNLTVVVSAAVAGSYINSLPSGALQTSNGNSVSPVIASLTVTALNPPVLVAPTLGKSFNPASISFGGVSTLVLTLTNSNSVIDTLTAPLTDQFPAGMTVAGGATTTCGGTVDAPPGSTSVTLTGGVIPAGGSCTVAVSVAVDCGCTYYNSVNAGALVTDNGSNAGLAAATLTVIKSAPGGLPTVSKYFYPNVVKPGVTTTLTITLTNPNSTVAALTAPFTDHLPSGMIVNGLPGTVPSNTCGGKLSAAKGSAQITLTGGRIPINGACKITVHVVAETAGTYVNSLPVGVLKTSNGNNPTGWKATLTVTTSAGAGTRLMESFSPAIIMNDQVSTLTIVLENPYGSAATLTAPLVDQMPTQMVVFGAASNTCGGVVTATAGSSQVILTGGAIPAKGSCEVTVTVTAPCNTYFNNLPAGALQTNNGTNQQPKGARLTVLPINM
jgi:uncharacterized repeat protein (TIGR01451 family)